jgi:hypothetical protein
MQIEFGMIRGIVEPRGPYVIRDPRRTKCNTTAVQIPGQSIGMEEGRLFSKFDPPCPGFLARFFARFAMVSREGQVLATDVLQETVTFSTPIACAKRNTISSANPSNRA